jgi:diguanylate cyclase (GGDEF)-like protein
MESKTRIPARRLLAAVAGFALSGCLAAQRLPFRVYGHQEGLVNLNIGSLLQDRAGLLWVGTQNGVFRYDGRNFKRFGREHGLPGSIITALLESGNGTLWVGTRNGLAWRKGDAFVRDETTANVEITALTRGPAGVVYAGSAQGLLEHRGEGWRWLLERQTIRSIHMGESGAVWFGCGLDLCRMDASGIEMVGGRLGLPRQRWDAILTDSMGSLWVRSTHQLWQLPRSRTRFRLHSEPPPAGLSGTLCLGQEGRLVAPTDFGLAIHGSKGWEILDQQRGLVSNAAEACLIDREGSLWIGFKGQGLARLLGDGDWQSWTEADGLASSSIWAIERDASGRLWAGTNAGLSLKAPGESRWRSLRLSNRGQGKKVRALALAPDGTMVAGLAPGGVARFSPDQRGQVRIFGPAAGLLDDTVLGVMFDREQHLWVSTRSGLYRAHPGTGWRRFERQTPPGSPARETFHECSLDAQGRVWAPGSRGVAVYDRGRWRRLTTADGLLANGVRKPALDRDGSVWLAYIDSHGVSRLRLDSSGALDVKHFVLGNGLRSDLAYFIAAAGDGALWAGTENGVDVLRGETWEHYSHEDGLVWNDCNANAVLQDADGSIWIGTSRGLSHFRNPRELRKQQHPTVLIGSIQANGAAQPLDRPLRLPYEQNSLEIAYLCPWYRNESEVGFEYRLAGLAAGWAATKDRAVRYDRLPAGAYTFEVRARLPGRRPGAAVSIDFTIATPWWQTLWFRAAVVLMGAFALTAMWRWRNSVLLARKRELEAAVEERTQQLEAEKAMLLLAREAMHQMATTDDLTGLWNRRAILEFLRRELDRAGRESSRLALIMLDLDQFKLINDTYGHAAGDHALRAAAKRLVENVRTYDGIGRYGGEEIMFVLPGCAGGEAMERAEQLRRSVEELSIVCSQSPEPLRITCSAGVAWLEAEARSAEELLAAADAALYLAKRSGRNHICTMRDLETADLAVTTSRGALPSPS